MTSMRLRTSLKVVVIHPLSCSIRRLRNRPSLLRSSTTAPSRAARPSAARTPATSAARPANSGARLRPSKPAAATMASSRLAALPPIAGDASVAATAKARRLSSQPFSRTVTPAFPAGSTTRSSQARAQKGQATSRTSVVPPFVMRTGPLSVVLDVGEALIGLRRAFESAALLTRLPLNDVFDLFGQCEVLVGHTFCRMVHQPHFDPGIGGRDVRMMPGRFRQMAHGIDHHECAFPTMRLVFSPDPAAL